ncbi:MAG: hypothetical protein B7Z32_11045 [Hydrogenophilales bacterium 12-64-13]|nr:MAG: hypothetical protein B7Z32_11045 [Hydrogenophilales bacterium 12-64-13]
MAVYPNALALVAHSRPRGDQRRPGGLRAGHRRLEILVRHAVWFALLGLVAGHSVLAAEGDTFRPYVSVNQVYDDNLFRLDDNETTAFSRSDYFRVLEAGLNVDWKPGRQQFLLDIGKTLIRYNSNDFLDFDGDNLRGTWNWRLGNHVKGKLGTSRTTSQSSFENIGLVNNSVENTQRFARADWEFHPRWQLGLGVNALDKTNSDPSQFSDDLERLARDLTLAYRTPKGSKLSAQIRQADADYPNLATLSQVLFFVDVADNSYEQTEYNLLGDWQASGKLRIESKVGWVERKYRNEFTTPPPSTIVTGFFDRPDFSGLVGRLEGDWFPTGKTLVNAAVYRELGGTTDTNSSAVLKHGVALNGVWLMREKWQLDLGVSYENRDFRGDPDSSGGPQRQDDTVQSSLSISYTPISQVSLGAGVQSGYRDANVVGASYQFNSVFVRARADF